jgi:hypothetical protein
VATPSSAAKVPKFRTGQLMVQMGALPKKKFYRQRAHCNPLNDSAMDVPLTPAALDWSAHFPAFVNPDGSAKVESVEPVVRIADVGCGFGGMTIECVPCTHVTAHAPWWHDWDQRAVPAVEHIDKRE